MVSKTKRCKQWEEFLEEYKEYFIEKSMKLQPKKEPKKIHNKKWKKQVRISQLHKDYKTCTLHPGKSFQIIFHLNYDKFFAISF